MLKIDIFLGHKNVVEIPEKKEKEDSERRSNGDVDVSFAPSVPFKSSTKKKNKRIIVKTNEHIAVMSYWQQWSFATGPKH